MPKGKKGKRKGKDKVVKKRPVPEKIESPPCAYRFDVIVMNVVSNAQDFEEKGDVEVTLTYREWNWIVPKENMFVVDFPKSGGFYKSETILDLSNELLKGEMIIDVTYKRTPLGYASLTLPVKLADEVKRMREGVYGEKVPIYNDEEAICGCIDILARFQPICIEDVLKVRPDPACPHLENLISPNDVMFVVGEPTSLFPCAENNPLLQNPKLKNLDFQKYRPYHGQILSETPSLPNMVCSLHCAGLKDITKKHGPDMAKKLICEPSCQGRVAKQSRVVASCLKLDLNPNDEGDDEGSSDEARNECYQHPRPLAQNMPPTTFADFKNLKPKYCPICRTDIKYLPGLATCPICGYKPEKPAEDYPPHHQLNVDEIVEEYGRKNMPQLVMSRPRCFEEEEEYVLPKACECRCKPNYLCPYCRVRKVCNIQTPKQNEEGKPKKKKSEEAAGPAVGEEVASLSGPDDPPYLEKVFSEVNALYGLAPLKCKLRQSGGSCVDNCKKDKAEQTLRQCTKLPASTACKDIKAIRSDPKNRKYCTCGHKDWKNTKPKPVRYNCKYKGWKMTKPKCGKCNPFGCLPCIKPKKNKCGNKLYDYCADRGLFPPKRHDHDMCYGHIPRVPCDKGWLWNVENKRRGWKPGAIPKTIKDYMTFFLADFPNDTLINSKYCYPRRKRKQPFTEIEQKTVLEIEKKNNEYFITFCPLKNSEALKTEADPFLNMEPIKVRIIENPLCTKIREIRECLREQGIRPCFCKQTAVMCSCRTIVEKNILLKALAAQCYAKAIPEYFPEISYIQEDCIDPEEEEYSFGVTPPAGIVRYTFLNKPDYNHMVTQYKNEDFTRKPLFRRKKNKYERLCKTLVKEAAEKRKELVKQAEAAKVLPVPKSPLDKFKMGPVTKKPVIPPKPPTRRDKLVAKIKKNPKLSRLVGPSGNLSMNAYIKVHPLPSAKAERAARMRRLKLLLSDAPMPFELHAKYDRLLRSCRAGQICTYCPPCGPCCARQCEV